MKKLSKKVIVIGIIILIISSLIIFSNSIFLTPKTKIPEMESEDITILNSNSKIMEAIEMVDESLVYDFLWGLVKYGPRRTSTDGCEKAGVYLFQQFENMGLETRYQEWTALNIYKFNIIILLIILPL